MSENTTHTSLRTLAKSILNRLENKKFIVFNPKQRGELQEDLFRRLSQTVLTEEDLNSMVREEVSTVSDAISDQNITETSAFQSRKKLLKSKVGENEVKGFYFKNTVRNTTISVREFLFESPFVEDVFESDEDIQKLVLETIQTFDESRPN